MIVLILDFVDGELCVWIIVGRRGFVKLIIVFVAMLYLSLPNNHAISVCMYYNLRSSIPPTIIHHHTFYTIFPLAIVC